MPLPGVRGQLSCSHTFSPAPLTTGSVLVCCPALIAIGRYSVTIETVEVGWCKEITDQGATLIAQSSKSLRYLGLMRCDKVNEVTVEQLVQQYPHITFSTVLQDCKRTLERAYQMGWTPNMSAASS
ncbi:F-box/LRR-repeat protein 17 [Microtus ochrogaster]|uniref:F-box/LRR-repeat protein 17 n=1 Tax=Microtus ochrogaster TaxID=79684 RepID=A0A8J6KQT3_MICOH|nr:F-box/LRR-repeat protein 17 [Microtus ochrogaster]